MGIQDPVLSRVPVHQQASHPVPKSFLLRPSRPDPGLVPEFADLRSYLFTIVIDYMDIEWIFLIYFVIRDSSRPDPGDF